MAIPMDYQMDFDSATLTSCSSSDDHHPSIYTTYSKNYTFAPPSSSPSTNPTSPASSPRPLRRKPVRRIRSESAPPESPVTDTSLSRSRDSSSPSPSPPCSPACGFLSSPFSPPIFRPKPPSSPLTPHEPTSTSVGLEHNSIPFPQTPRVSPPVSLTVPERDGKLSEGFFRTRVPGPTDEDLHVHLDENGGEFRGRNLYREITERESEMGRNSKLGTGQRIMPFSDLVQALEADDSESIRLRRAKGFDAAKAKFHQLIDGLGSDGGRDNKHTPQNVPSIRISQVYSSSSTSSKESSPSSYPSDTTVSSSSTSSSAASETAIGVAKKIKFSLTKKPGRLVRLSVGSSFEKKLLLPPSAAENNNKSDGDRGRKKLGISRDSLSPPSPSRNHHRHHSISSAPHFRSTMGQSTKDAWTGHPDSGGKAMKMLPPLPPPAAGLKKSASSSEMSCGTNLKKRTRERFASLVYPRRHGRKENEDRDGGHQGESEVQHRGRPGREQGEEEVVSEFGRKFASKRSGLSGGTGDDGDVDMS